MITLSSFIESYNKIKSLPQRDASNPILNSSSNLIHMDIDSNENIESSYNIFIDYLTSKFPESSKIFSKLSTEYSSINDLVNLSIIKDYNENDIIFEKDSDCLIYLFILYGDINCYEEKDNKNLLKTVSSGQIFGQKIKDKYKFYGKSNGKVTILSINKSDFDSLIVKTNEVKHNFKLEFIKKFFPHMRLFTNDVLDNLMQFFIREKYMKKERIFKDDEYDEYIYLIIKGKVGVAKNQHKLNINLTVNNINQNSTEPTSNPTIEDHINHYIILEYFTKGDIFGIYSALKYNKTNYTAITFTDTEVYKISKSHLLFYFGGNYGFIPKALKSIDSTQQSSHENKIKYICEMVNNKKNHQFIEKLIANNFLSVRIKNCADKKVIDESKIENNLADAWKSLQNLDSKLHAFKESLLNDRMVGLKNDNSNNKNKVDLFSKFAGGNKEFNQVSGDGTNKVAARKLLVSQKQINSLGKLGSICGVKKKTDDSDIKKLMEIKSKVEGKKNLLMGFEDTKGGSTNNNSSLLNSLNNKNSSSQSESKISNTNPFIANGNNSISDNNKSENINSNKIGEDTNIAGTNPKTATTAGGPELKLERPAVPANKKRNKHSLRNLLE